MPSTILLMSCKLHLGEVTCSKSYMVTQSPALPSAILGFFFSSECFPHFIQIKAENVLTHKGIRRI